MARLFCAVALALLCSSFGAGAASLQVQPALLDILAPGAAATINLRNDGTAPINVQIRVFRWSQADGNERLEPTEEVVASPPEVTLAPHADYVARIVRVVKRPIGGEEAYRLLVDELPDATPARANTVRLLVRHSIPVFFSAADRMAAAVDWSVSRKGDRLVVSARNKGDVHLRISALSLRDVRGRTISFGSGLVGYALGRSTMRWTAPGPARGFATSGSAAISGQGNNGPFSATAPITSAP